MSGLKYWVTTSPSSTGRSAAASLDSMLSHTVSETASLNALLQQTKTKTASMDAQLVASLSYTTHTLTASMGAILSKASQLKTASLDAQIVYRSIPVDRYVFVDPESRVSDA